MPEAEAQISRQEQFSGTKEVTDAHRMDAASLAAYLRDHVPDFKGPLTVRQFKGGQSNPTYQLITPGRAYVLRRKPPGRLLPSAHAVDREFRVISALHGAGFPVPRPFCLCTDDSVAGTMFYVMEMVEGRIIWEAVMPGAARDERRRIYEAMNETLARLHTLDYEDIGLADFGRPGNYFSRQISRWSKQYRASETETIAEMNLLMEWLPENIPEGGSASVVHGDYRLDNMVLHPTEPRILAVLDWELSTLGDPLADFTYNLMQWKLPPTPATSSAGVLCEADLDALGIPGLDAYVRMYCRHTGRDGIEDLDFYFAYNLFRLAGILQGIVGRVRDGTAASTHAEQTAANVRPLATLGWHYATMSMGRTRPPASG